MTPQEPKKLMQIKRPDPKKAKFVDFSIEKEQWDMYRLADKSLLKGRYVLSGFIIDKTIDELKKEMKHPKSNQPLKIGFSFKGHRLYVVQPPANLRGEPDKMNYPLEELRASIEERDIDFETVKSTWSSYKLKNGMVFKCRLSPTTVNKTSKFDDGGMPLYLIDSALDVKITLPPDLERMLEKRAKARKKPQSRSPKE